MPTAPRQHRPLGQTPRLQIERKLSDRGRPSANARGYTYRWRLASKAFLAEFPLCKHCLALGMVVAAALVDHIVPHRGDKKLFWRRDNWQSLCDDCHNRKTGAGE